MLTRQSYIPTNPGASASAEENIRASKEFGRNGNDELTFHNVHLKRTAIIKG
jgi:hypothetical protein